MIRLEDSNYDFDLPPGRFVFPLGRSPFALKDEECDECHSNKFRVAVFAREDFRGGRAFFGGLIFLTCGTCETVFVTRMRGS